MCDVTNIYIILMVDHPIRLEYLNVFYLFLIMKDHELNERRLYGVVSLHMYNLSLEFYNLPLKVCKITKIKFVGVYILVQSCLLAKP